MIPIFVVHRHLQNGVDIFHIAVEATKVVLNLRSNDASPIKLREKFPTHITSFIFNAKYNLQSENFLPTGRQSFIFRLSLQSGINELQHAERVAFTTEVSGSETLRAIYLQEDTS